VHVGFALLTLFPGRVGGTETNVRGLLGQFADGNGPDRVTVLANRHVAGAYGHYARGPVSLHHVRSYRAGDSMATRLIAMTAARALPRRVARDVPAGLDLVHYPVTVPIPQTDLPRVVSLYDVQHLDLPEFFSRGERLYRRWAYDSAARSATVVITTSEYSKRRLVESVGVPEESIEVVHLGIDHSRFVPDGVRDEAALEALDLPERFVVYPANMWPHKNHERLIDALALTGDPRLALVLTGQPYGRLGRLMERARARGVRDRVRHLGFLSREALPALFRRAQGLVFPSLYEGFGSPPLEAMACGCPVASSSRGSLDEICGDAALGFDPESAPDIASALDRLTTDSDLRARLHEAGLRRAREFSWSDAAARHAAIYERAAETRSAPAPL
jgi:glycosyltransferase involved in cell wall biosynthesis